MAPSRLQAGFSTLPPRSLWIVGLLLAANLLAWLWALAVFHAHPALLATALLAYTFGLRHAVDADHIAAIDNVTRKLVQQGERPLGVGFFFALGHSAVVVLGAVATALAADLLRGPGAGWRELGAFIGTSVSVAFLFAIALVNLSILIGVYRSFLRVRRGGRLEEADLDTLLSGGGLLQRLFRPLFRLISKSWHMLALGFLFGLGFDTATEIGLLGISAAEASKGLSLWSILVFPALFTAGMALVDTADGALMLGAYGWALLKPIRKLYYNLVVTALSVVIAFLVGGIEALGLLADKLALTGAFWDAIGAINDNWSGLGFAIVALFVVSWGASLMLYRLKATAAARDAG